MKCTPEVFAAACFLALMRGETNADGLDTKAPCYIEEKIRLLSQGFGAIHELDLQNQYRVRIWYTIWYQGGDVVMHADWMRDVRAAQLATNEGAI